MRACTNNVAAVVFLGTLAAIINGCSTGFAENADVDESNGLDSQSLEQELDLVPQLLQAKDIGAEGKSLDASICDSQSRIGHARPWCRCVVLDY